MHPALTDPALCALAADGPHPDHADALMLFGRFAGAWDMDGDLHDGSGTRHFTGEWLFGWVLAGRAIQDVLISPARSELDGGERTLEYGSTLRFYDPERDLWQVTWMTPVNRRVERLAGGAVGNDIVLEGDSGDRRLRWSFEEIEPDRFTWRGRVSTDGGATWRLAEEMRLHRRSG